MNYDDLFSERLAQVHAQGRARRLRTFPGVGGRLNSPTGPLLNFSSNDYLDLASDPRLKRAAACAVDEAGCGATASRLMAGQLKIHEALEEALAALVDQPAALAFPSGFQTNLAVVSTLFDDAWTLFSDALNHASLIDGCRLSKARVEVYPHNDTAALETRLRAVTGPKAILTESIFSMDGDRAPLTEIARLAVAYSALLVVDEAHAIGICGNGGGVCRELGIRPHVTIGTLGKSLGSAGGFAGCSVLLRDLLINTARPFIFSTGLAPACAAAALEAIHIVTNDASLGPELLARSAAFRARLQAHDLDVPDGDSPIVPVLIGGNEETLEAAAALQQRGILAVGIRPPTVPEGTSRLRLSVTLAHHPAELERAAQAIAETAPRHVRSR